MPPLTMDTFKCHILRKNMEKWKWQLIVCLSGGCTTYQEPIPFFLLSIKSTWTLFHPSIFTRDAYIISKIHAIDCYYSVWRKIRAPTTCLFNWGEFYSIRYNKILHSPNSKHWNEAVIYSNSTNRKIDLWHTFLFEI